MTIQKKKKTNKKTVKIFFTDAVMQRKTFGNAKLGKRDIPNVMQGTSFNISAKSTLLRDRI